MRRAAAGSPPRLPRDREGADHEEEEEEEDRMPAPTRSGFSALATSSPSPSPSSEEEEDVDGKPAASVPAPPAGKTAPSSNANKKTKKKKKKGGAKKGQASAPSAASDDDDLDGLDDLSPPPPPAAPQAQQARAPPMLAFDPAHLNPDSEVKRKLGVAMAPSAKPGKKTLFTTPDNWPSPPSFASGQGAHMILKDGFLTYEASAGYRAAQQHFQSLVLTYDPQLIADMLAQHPFHVDALLQHYDFLVASGQNEAAYACLRRALYVLESWASPTFKKSLGTATLRLKPFPLKPDALKDDWGEDAGLNGALLRALTLSMRLAGRRDCFEAAFALVKLLVSLDPLSDPSQSCLCLDYYCIRAGKAQWLVENVKIFNWDPLVLPNAAFAKALALRLLNQNDRADKEIQLAIRRWPNFVVALCPDFDSPWLVAHLSKDNVLDRLARIAATRHANLWKDPVRITWLQSNVRSLASSGVGALSDFPAHARVVQEYYARAVLSDFSDVVAIIPREEAPNPAGAAPRRAAAAAEGPGVVARLVEFLANALLPTNHVAELDEDESAEEAR